MCDACISGSLKQWRINPDHILLMYCMYIPLMHVYTVYVHVYLCAVNLCEYTVSIGNSFC